MPVCATRLAVTCNGHVATHYYRNAFALRRGDQENLLMRAHDDHRNIFPMILIVSYGGIRT